MENKDLINVGFQEISHFTIGNTLIFPLGRDRHLSASNIGTPNEFLYICSTDDKDSKKITDLICLHNYDYDGYLTMEKIIGLIKILK